MKQTNSGLTKVWRVEKSSTPFYKGGKVQVFHDEKKFVCMFENNVKFVDMHDGNLVEELMAETDASEGISCFCIHPNGNEIVVATEKFSLRHWDLEKKVCLRVIKGHNMPIIAMAYDTTGTLVATASADRTVKVWDIAKGYCTHNFKFHTDIVQTVYFHPDPSKMQLFSTGSDNTIRVYDLTATQLVATLSDHVSLPTQVTLSQNGRLLVSSGRDKILNFYETGKFSLVKTVPIMEELESVVVLNAEHAALILTSTGEEWNENTYVVLTAGERGILKMYKIFMKGLEARTFSLVPIVEFPLSVGATPSSALSDIPDAAKNLKRIVSLLYMPLSGEVLTVSNDYNLASYSMESLVERINSEDQQEEVFQPTRLMIGSHGEILDMAVFPGSTADEFQVALVSNSNQIRVIDQNFSCRVLDGHSDIVLCVDVSPDGKWLTTSSKDKTVVLWNTSTMRSVAIGESHTDAVGCVCLSRSKAIYQSRAPFIVSGGGDKILKRWAFPTHLLSETKSSSASSKLTPSHSIHAHDKDINSVDLAPNDMLVASGSQDKTVKLWNSSNLSLVATLNGHKRGVWKVLFSSVDKVLASCSGDRTVRMWSVVDFTTLRTFDGHTASVLCIKFVNNGSQLISGSADGLVRLWTIRTGECENTFDQHEDKVWTLESVESAATVEGETKSDGIFFSGGGDSLFAMWKDVTESENLLAIVAAEDVLLMEQQFSGDLRRKDYEKALIGAINLKHSLKVLNVLAVILEQDNRGDAVTSHIDSNNAAGQSLELFEEVWSKRLDPYVAKLSDEHIEVILVYLKDWNTNSRHCYVSQILISSFLRVVKIDRMMKFNVFKELIPGLLSYSERHFQRLNRLHQATYMLSYATSQISLLPVEEQVVKPIKMFKSVTNGGDATTEEDEMDVDDEDSVQIFKQIKVSSEDSTEGVKKGKKQKV